MDKDDMPAFPRDERYLGHNGMTLRDWFAGQAMAAIIGKHEAIVDFGPDEEGVCESCARGAYEYADAMMEDRKG